MIIGVAGKYCSGKDTVSKILVEQGFVNIDVDKIEEIIPWFNYTCKLKMKNTDEELLVSRSYYKQFKERFLIK